MDFVERQLTYLKVIPEFDAQVLDHGNQAIPLNASGEVSRSYVRLHGLGISFNQLSHRTKEIAGQEASLGGLYTRTQFPH